MPTAREIAEERFARGEITEAELEKILGVLGSNSAGKSSAQEKSEDNPDKVRKKSGLVTSWQWDAGCAVALFFIISAMTSNVPWDSLNTAGKTILTIFSLMFVFSVVSAIASYRRGESW